MAQTPYTILRRKIILDILEKFPDASIWALARIAYKENPKLFKSVEDARSLLRVYTGTCGKFNREKIVLKKFYREPKQLI